MSNAPEPDQAGSVNKDIRVDMEMAEDPFESPEIQAKKELQDKRTARALTFIDKIIPPRTLDQVLVDQRRHTWYLPDKSEEGIKANAQYNLQREIKERGSLAFSIAYLEVPEEDFEEYISTIYDIGKEISAPDSGIGTQELKNLVFSIDNLRDAKVFTKLASKWKERFMTGVDNDTIDERSHVVGLFKDLSGAGISPRPETRTEEEMNELFDVYMDSYSVFYSLPNDELEQKIADDFVTGVRGIGTRRKDAIQARRLLTTFNKIVNDPDRETVKSFIDVVSHYSRNHDISEDSVTGLSDKLFASMQKKDPQIEIILKAGNNFGMNKRDFGAGDFLVHCYVGKVNPQTISELLLISRDVPTTELARMEQNRLDGLSLAGPFGNLRDFIHDQRPYVHDLMLAMVQYYDTGDRTQLDAIIPKTDYFNSTERIDMLYDRSLYDRVTTEVKKDERVDSGMKSIDFLRRLEKNTEPISDIPPETSDTVLNQIAQKLQESKINGLVPKEMLAQGLDYINSSLEQMMKRNEIGIDPNHILSLAWFERQAYGIIHNLSYEDQSQAYLRPWFISILRFQELICSPQDFNKAKFGEFVSRLQESKSDTEAYRLIGSRVLGSVYQLAKIESDRGRKEVGGIWSGNLPHELIGLIDEKSAKTEQGRRAREEDLKRKVQPGYHPGD